MVFSSRDQFCYPYLSKEKKEFIFVHLLKHNMYQIFILCLSPLVYWYIFVNGYIFVFVPAFLLFQYQIINSHKIIKNYNK